MYRITILDTFPNRFHSNDNSPERNIVWSRMCKFDLPHSTFEQQRDFFAPYIVRSTWWVIIVSPEVSWITVWCRIHEAIRGGGIQNRRKRGVGVPEPCLDPRVICLESWNTFSKFIIKISNDGLFGGLWRGWLSKHQRRPINGRDIDKQKIRGSIISEPMQILHSGGCRRMHIYPHSDNSCCRYHLCQSRWRTGNLNLSMALRWACLQQYPGTRWLGPWERGQ